MAESSMHASRVERGNLNNLAYSYWSKAVSHITYLTKKKKNSEGMQDIAILLSMIFH